MADNGEDPIEEINGVKIEHHDDKNKCNLQQSSNVISWILTEIQKKQEDYITIICKDGEQCRVSGLLLVAVSPFLADTLYNINLEECSILMPDVEVSSVTRIFERIYQLGCHGFQDIEFSKPEGYDDPLQVNGKLLKDPFQSIFSSLQENEFVDLKRDPESDLSDHLDDAVKAEPKDFDIEQAAADMVANDTVIIKRLKTNHDQSKVSVLTKFEFNVNPSDFDDAGDDILMEDHQFLESEEDDKPLIKRKLKGKKLKKIKCEECGKELCTRGLIKHIKKAHREEPLSCDVCSKSFFVKSEFEKHINKGGCDPVQKAKEEMLQCLECGRQCQNKTELLAHKQEDGSWCGGDLPPEDNADADYDEGGGEDEDGDQVSPRKKETHLYRNKRSWCQICEKDFETIKKRSVHMRQQHVNRTCQTCHQEFILEVELKAHVEKEHKAVYVMKFKCYKCQDMFRKTDNLKRHLQIKHSDMIKRFSCHLCKFTTPYQTSIERHDQKHHELDGKTKKEVICEDCGKSFATQRSLDYKIHKANHQADKFSCECGITFENKKQKVHHMQVVHVKDLMGCDQCFFICVDLNQLKTHMSVHKAESFTCDCELEFENKDHRIHHMQSVHLKELVCCTKCHFVTNTNWNLEKHDKKVHIEVPSSPSTWVCDVCGQTFIKKAHHTDHMARNHDPVLLTCPKCPKQYNARKMQDHLYLAHRDSGVCNVCGIEVQQLKMHMKHNHTPKHLLQHQCPDCDKAFHFKQRLKKHQMNVHLKLRPYKCRYGCEFAYNDSGNRGAHEKKKHGSIFTTRNQDPIKDE